MRIKQPIMVIMLGIAFSVMLFTLSSLSFAFEFHRWDFYYDAEKGTYLDDPDGHWWDEDQTKTLNDNYVSFVEQIIPDLPRVTPLPWLWLTRIPNDYPADLGGHAKIYTKNTSTGVRDNPVAGKFQYSAYFMLNSLPSSSSCQANPGLPFWCEQASCRPHAVCVAKGAPEVLPEVPFECCGQVDRHCKDHSCNAWYVVVEVGGDKSIGAPIYVAYDDTVRGFFTNRPTKKEDPYGSENPDEVIAWESPNVPYHVETGRWYYVTFTV
jgi:hypothetical protein